MSGFGHRHIKDLVNLLQSPPNLRQSSKHLQASWPSSDCTHKDLPTSCGLKHCYHCGTQAVSWVFHLHLTSYVVYGAFAVESLMMSAACIVSRRTTAEIAKTTGLADNIPSSSLTRHCSEPGHSTPPGHVHRQHHQSAAHTSILDFSTCGLGHADEVQAITSCSYQTPSPAPGSSRRQTSDAPKPPPLPEHQHSRRSSRRISSSRIQHATSPSSSCSGGLQRSSSGRKRHLFSDDGDNMQTECHLQTSNNKVWHCVTMGVCPLSQ